MNCRVKTGNCHSIPEVRWWWPELEGGGNRSKKVEQTSVIPWRRGREGQGTSEKSRVFWLEHLEGGGWWHYTWGTAEGFLGGVNNTGPVTLSSWLYRSWAWKISLGKLCLLMLPQDWVPVLKLTSLFSFCEHTFEHFHKYIMPLKKSD